METEAEVEKLVDRIEADIPREEWPTWPGGWKGDIEAAVLDAIFSIRARYGGENTGVRGVVKRWRESRGEGRDDLKALEAFEGREDELLEILQNRQKLGSGQTKASAAVEAAKALLKAGVRTSSDIKGTDEERIAWCSVTGLGEVTWSYARMLLGVPGVKADVMVMRLVGSTIARSVTATQARELVLAAAQRMQVDATDLDHAIWSWQRKR
jgi:hypothetical protein